MTQSEHWSAASIYPRNAVSTAGDEGAPIDGWNHRLGVGTIHYAWSERPVRLREDHDNCANFDAIVEVDHVLVGHANAARGDGSADIFRLVGAVDLGQIRHQLPVARAPAGLSHGCKRLLHAAAEHQTDNYEYNRTHRLLVKRQSHRLLGRRCRRLDRVGDEVRARTALIKVAIGEVQSSD
jgi:hypothetical protein